VFYDPHVKVLPRTRAWPHLSNRASEELTGEEIEKADVVLLITAHAGVDYEMVASKARLILDTRGVYRGERGNVVGA
jgi:UDP-N-acetyl-D-glucosamine dehydrogenase